MSRSCLGTSSPKATHFAPPSGIYGSRTIRNDKRWVSNFPAIGSNQVASDTNNNGSGNNNNSLSDDQLPAASSSPLNTEDVSQVQTTEAPKGSVVFPQKDTSLSPDSKSKMKGSPLTAREKLRAARIRGRNVEAKAPKPELRRSLLDSLMEIEKGKMRSGLPKAPADMFEDSNRTLPKQGLVFEFPGGIDVFFVVVSFVFICTVMFGTTYIVWKVGAIHFNEY